MSARPGLVERRATGAVETALADLAAGRMVVLCDDRDRGGEGDLLLGAEHASAEAVNFMAKEARGVVCLALGPERADELGLEPIAPRGRSALGDASLISVEAKDGVTTGISAGDRARTSQVAVDPSAGAEDFVRPGHVFPLRAEPGGVLERAGRIESAVDLAADSGLLPAGVLCQVLREDGRTARGADLDRFAERHGLNLVTVSAVVERRLAAAAGSNRADAPNHGRPLFRNPKQRTTTHPVGGDAPHPDTDPAPDPATDPASAPDPGREPSAPDRGREMRDVMGHFATGHGASR